MWKNIYIYKWNLENLSLLHSATLDLRKLWNYTYCTKFCTKFIKTFKFFFYFSKLRKFINYTRKKMPIKAKTFNKGFSSSFVKSNRDWIYSVDLLSTTTPQTCFARAFCIEIFIQFCIEVGFILFQYRNFIKNRQVSLNPFWTFI